MNDTKLGITVVQDLPAATPVQTHISAELFGDAVMVLEYLMCFNSLFDIQDEHPSFISLGK